ncbi:transcription elongation factor A protein 2-like [Gastrophryne carolinensis]
MGSEENLLKIGRRLEKKISEQNVDHILDLLKELQRFPVTVPLLRSTRIGVIINKIRKQNKDHQIVDLARIIIRDWKRLLESSYKNNGVSTLDVKQSPSRTESTKACSDVAQSPSRLPTANDHSKLKRECSELRSTSQSQQTAEKELKIKRACSDVPQTPSLQPTANDPKLKSSSNVLASSPTCSSPPSLVLLPPSYLTGDSVRDKCLEMVAAALKTDGDYVHFGANCERLAWEIEEYILLEMKATDMKYRNRIRSRISNLKDPKNPNLRRNVLCGTVSAEKIATMTAEEMASDELKELRNTLTQEAIREHQMAKTGGTQTDLLQCDKCKKKNCTYNQVQTRSADEPMTTFVLCNECGHRWKVSSLLTVCLLFSFADFLKCFQSHVGLISTPTS